MNRFNPGDRVRVDIPDKTDRDDTDFDQYHGRHGTVVDVLEDDADATTGDSRDGTLYRVEFENGDIHDFRWRDLRPA